MPLPLYDGANHVLDENSPEITRFIQETRDGMAVGGWELAVPEPGPDGNPFLFIFVGPTAEHRGSGLRLHMAAADGSAIPDTAQVLVESFYKTGSERQTIFAGEYGEFSGIANQEDRTPRYRRSGGLSRARTTSCASRCRCRRAGPCRTRRRRARTFTSTA